MTNHDSELIVYCQLQGTMDFAMLGPEDSQTLDILVGNQSSCQFFLLPFELPAEADCSTALLQNASVSSGIIT